MKLNKVIGLLAASMMGLSVVRCGKYKIENEDAYNKGYYKYAVAEGVDAISSDYKFYGVICGAVDSECYDELLSWSRMLDARNEDYYIYVLIKFLHFYT